MDARGLRRCLARFTTGVTVVTYQTPEGTRGATINSFTSVSMDPPLVLISLARKAQACAALDGVPFAINVLRSDQMDVALQFAGRPRPGAHIPWDQVDGAVAPSLSQAVAVFRCRPWQRYDGGDHVLQLGEVVDAEIRGGDPLVFGDGRFTVLGLPIMDGPLVYSLDQPPAPGWTGAVHRLHHLTESG